MSALQLRAMATRATMDHFGTIKFGLGKGDCAQMIAFHLEQLGRPIVNRLAARSYNKPHSAVRVLRETTGFDTLPAWLNSHFPVIPPAACLIGDVISMPSTMEIGALGIAAGNGVVIAYSEEHEYLVSGRLVEGLSAWRVL